MLVIHTLICFLYSSYLSSSEIINDNIFKVTEEEVEVVSEVRAEDSTSLWEMEDRATTDSCTMVEENKVSKETSIKVTKAVALTMVDSEEEMEDITVISLLKQLKERLENKAIKAMMVSRRWVSSMPRRKPTESFSLSLQSANIRRL